jgi:hypothetical protein
MENRFLTSFGMTECRNYYAGEEWRGQSPRHSSPFFFIKNVVIPSVERNPNETNLHSS